VNHAGGPASDPGRLSSSDVTGHVTVPASNDPYGGYVFANDSRQVGVAEDYDNALETTAARDVGTVSLLVEKTPGAADYIQVIILITTCTVWLNGLVVSALAVRARCPGFESRVAPLFHWVATLGKLFTHIASPVS